MEIVRTIGRGLNNKIVINKPGIADVHAEITFAPGFLMMIEDLGSSTGTFVNNRRIQGKKILKPTDVVSFGEHVFPFEEHYPEMLKTQTSKDVVLDSGKDDGEPEELRAENDANEKEALVGTKGIKRWIYALQFPKNRQKVQRLWFLGISSVMLLCIVLPWLSWGNLSQGTIFVDDKFEPVSGVSTFLGLITVEISGASLLYILLYGVTLFLIIGAAIVFVFCFLAGINVWKTQNYLSIRRMSQVMLGLYGLNFVLQFLRYVNFWLDGQNALVQSRQVLVNKISESHVYIENMGIGYWLCGFSILLIFKSTRNGIWRPTFHRRWATLSFTFWLPMAILISLVHTGTGVVQTNIDSKNFNKSMIGYSGNTSNYSKEVKERICQNAPNMANAAYIYLIREWKRDEDKKNRLRGVIQKKEKDLRKEAMNYMTGVLITLHGILIVAVAMLIRKRIQGITSLILSLALVVLSSLLYYSLHNLIFLRPEFRQEYVEVSVGYGCYLAIALSLCLVGEQFHFWTKRKGNEEKKEDLQPLDILND